MAPALVDAFKSMSIPPHSRAPFQPLVDLIRHGRNHNTVPKSTPEAPHPDSDARGLRQQNPPLATPPEAKHAAEPILKEERRQKSHMPVYKGLEGYELTDKMGESVSLPRFVCGPH